jgi:8-amino-7-oxononanoate synthase
VANLGRAYIYSTEIAPPFAAGIEAALGVMRDEPQRQKRVRELAKSLRGALRAKGWDLAEGDSPIVPLILGSEAEALRLSRELLEKGLLVLAVRPPTVPKGTSRLRITLNCEHSQMEIEKLADSLVQ